MLTRGDEKMGENRERMSMQRGNELTSIPLKRETQQRLKARKIHPNQAYDEVIMKMMQLLDKTKKKGINKGF